MKFMFYLLFLLLVTTWITRKYTKRPDVLTKKIENSSCSANATAHIKEQRKHDDFQSRTIKSSFKIQLTKFFSIVKSFLKSLIIILVTILILILIFKYSPIILKILYFILNLIWHLVSGLLHFLGLLCHLVSELLNYIFEPIEQPPEQEKITDA